MNLTENKLDARQKLVETATRLFHAQGYQATGINQIIDEADVCKASFYHHFKTKDDLLLATLEQKHARAMAEMHSQLATRRTGRDKLAHLFTMLEQMLVQGGFRGCTYANTSAEFPDGNSPVHEVVRSHHEARKALLREVVGAILRETRRDREGLEAMVDGVYALILGGGEAARVMRDVKPVRAAHAAAQKLLGIGES
jgi:AcrR family transcriptional regulator